MPYLENKSIFAVGFKHHKGTITYFIDPCNLNYKTSVLNFNAHLPCRRFQIVFPETFSFFFMKSTILHTTTGIANNF